MLIYIAVFCISIIATYNAQKCDIKSVTFIVNSCFAIIPLVILAACRDSHIGTDTSNYIFLFEDAVANNDNILYYILSNPSFEIGFLAYNFCIAQITTSVVTYYIITYGIVIGLVYISAIKLKKYISPHIFILIYLFLFFSDSLNVMRQYISVSCVLFAISNLLTKKYKQYFLLTIIAVFVHTSAIISLVIGLMFFLTKKYPINSHKSLYILTCFIILAIAMNIDYFANIGLLPTFEDKLNNYLTDSTAGGLSNSHIAVCLCTLLFLLSTKEKDSTLDMMLLITCFTMIFYMSPSMNTTLYRLTIYFNVITCFSVSYVHKKTLKYSSKLILLLAIYIFFYFFSTVLAGTNSVIPYSSTLLGI